MKLCLKMGFIFLLPLFSCSLLQKEPGDLNKVRANWLFMQRIQDTSDFLWGFAGKRDKKIPKEAKILIERGLKKQSITRMEFHLVSFKKRVPLSLYKIVQKVNYTQQESVPRLSKKYVEETGCVLKDYLKESRKISHIAEKEGKENLDVLLIINLKSDFSTKEAGKISEFFITFSSSPRLKNSLQNPIVEFKTKKKY